MHPNEIELIVLDGPVYVKNEDSEYELLAKNSALMYFLS
jgi:quercetin dioxygenase-like cupin family protein